MPSPLLLLKSPPPPQKSFFEHPKPPGFVGRPELGSRCAIPEGDPGCRKTLSPVHVRYFDRARVQLRPLLLSRNRDPLRRLTVQTRPRRNGYHRP